MGFSIAPVHFFRGTLGWHPSTCHSFTPGLRDAANTGLNTWRGGSREASEDNVGTRMVGNMFHTDLYRIRICVYFLSLTHAHTHTHTYCLTAVLEAFRYHMLMYASERYAFCRPVYEAKVLPAALDCDSHRNRQDNKPSGRRRAFYTFKYSHLQCRHPFIFTINVLHAT